MKDSYEAYIEEKAKGQVFTLDDNPLFQSFYFKIISDVVKFNTLKGTLTSITFKAE
jgi:hypothetical protein